MAGSISTPDLDFFKAFDELEVGMNRKGVTFSRALRQYIEESEETDWQGLTPTEVSVIREFFTDFAIWYENDGFQRFTDGR